MKSTRTAALSLLVILALLLATAACATFRSPDEPLPTAVWTLTSTPALTTSPTPTPTLTQTPTPTFTPPEATPTER